MLAIIPVDQNDFMMYVLDMLLKMFPSSYYDIQ